MQRRTKLGIAGIAAVVCALLITQQMRGQREIAEPSGYSGSGQVASAVELELPSSEPDLRMPDSRQEELAEPTDRVQSPEPATENTEVVTEADSVAATAITATCVDLNGLPISGVTFTVLNVAGAGQILSDIDGRIRFELDARFVRIGKPMLPMQMVGGPMAFELSGAGLARRVVFGPPLEGVAAHDCGPVELGPGGAVVGRVVDADGDPLGGVTVHAVPALPELSDAERESLRLSGLSFLSFESGGPSVETDFDGRFLFEGVSTEPSCLWAQDAGTYAVWTDTILLKPGETHEVQPLALERLGSEDRIAGRVLDIEGRPSPGALVVAQTRSESAMGPQVMRQANLEGYFVIPALEGVKHRVSAWQANPEIQSVSAIDVLGGTLDLELRFGETEGEVVPAPELIARVVRLGEPEPGANVAIYLYADDSRRPAKPRHFRTDADGSFSFPIPPRPLRIEVQSADREWVGLSEHRSLDELKSGQEILIELQSAASIEGRVLFSPGMEQGGLQFRVVGPAGGSREVSTSSGGTFRIDGLYSGMWNVSRVLGWNEGEPTSLELIPGMTAEYELDLRGGAEFHGRLALGDQAYSGWNWGLRSNMGSVATDGTFQVAGIEDLGEARLMLVGLGPTSMVQLRLDLTIAPGNNEWSFELPTGSVELTGLPLAEEFPYEGEFEPTCCLRYVHADGTIWEAMAITAKEGRRVIEHVPAGRIVVLRRGTEAAMHRALDPSMEPIDTAEVLGEFEVRAGETTTFEFRE